MICIALTFLPATRIAFYVAPVWFLLLLGLYKYITNKEAQTKEEVMVKKTA